MGSKKTDQRVEGGRGGGENDRGERAEEREGGRKEERKNESGGGGRHGEANEGQLVLVLNYSWPLRVFFETNGGLRFHLLA